MNKILKSAATVALISVVTRLTAFGYKIFLSRTLGAASLGSYQIALSIFFTICSIPSSGIPLALSRKIAALCDKKESDGLVTSAVIISEVIAFAICGALLIFPPLRQSLVKGESENVFLNLMPAVLSSTCYAVIRARFWGMGKFSAYSIIEALEGILRMALGITLIATNTFGSSVMAASTSFVVSDFVSAIILLIVYLVDGGRFARPIATIDIIKSALPMTSVRFFSELVPAITAVILPRVLVKVGVPLYSALADYGRISGMALPVLMAPSTIIGALSVVLVPELAADHSRKKTRSIVKKTSAALSFSTLVSCIAISVFIPVGKTIAKVLFDDTIAGNFITTIAPLILIFNIGSTASSCLNSMGAERTTMKNYMIGSVIMLAAIILLPRYVGIYSMLIGLALSHLVTCALNLWHLKKIAGISKLFFRNVLLGLLCAFCSTTMTATLLKICRFSDLLSAVIGTVFAMSSCTALMYSLGLIDFGYFFHGTKKRPAATGR